LPCIVFGERYRHAVSTGPFHNGGKPTLGKLS
jgi:hypothetical protein